MRTCQNPVWLVVTCGLFLLVKCRSFSFQSSPTKNNKNNNNNVLEVQYVPCRLTLDGVSQRYPPNAWRRLTSSVPHRDYALYNISFSIQSSDLLFITGASSCGKSTLLQLIQQTQQPNHALGNTQKHVSSPTNGTIKLESIIPASTISTTDRSSSSVRADTGTPVYLAPPKPTYGTRDTVADVINDTLLRHLPWRKRTRDNNPDPIMDDALIRHVADDLMECVGLAKKRATATSALIEELNMDQMWKRLCTQLSPSEIYRLELVRACIQSMFASKEPSCVHHNPPTTEDLAEHDRSDHSCKMKCRIPAPILLLDEWLDTEASVVVQTVQAALENLCRHSSAVVVCVTHHPERFRKTTMQTSKLDARTKVHDDTRADRCIRSYLTLCRGEILLLNPPL